MRRVLQTFSRGSILAYSLILLGIVLVASVGMMAASVTNLRSVSSNDKSINAFQIADSGSQAAIAKIKAADSSARVSSLYASVSACNNDDPINLLGGDYRLSFYDQNDAKLGCNDDVSEITSIKSVGAYQDVARAVRVAVAQSGGGGVTGGCQVRMPDASTYQVVYTWGSGCESRGSSGSRTNADDACHGAADNSHSCGFATGGLVLPPASEIYPAGANCFCVES